MDGQVLTQVSLLDEGQQRLPVLRPQGRKLLGRRELAAGELQSQLQTLSPHVVVVLHPACTHIHTRHKFYMTNHSAAPTHSCDVTNVSQRLLAVTGLKHRLSHTNTASAEGDSQPHRITGLVVRPTAEKMSLWSSGDQVAAVGLLQQPADEMPPQEFDLSGFRGGGAGAWL